MYLNFHKKATMVEIGNQQIRYLIIGYKCFVLRCFRFDPANSRGLMLLPLVPVTEARLAQQDHFASWLVLINLHQPGSYTSTDCAAWSNFEQFDTLACCGPHLDLHLDLHLDDLPDYPRDHHNLNHHPVNRPQIRWYVTPQVNRCSINFEQSDLSACCERECCGAPLIS